MNTNEITSNQIKLNEILVFVYSGKPDYRAQKETSEFSGNSVY